MTPAMAREFYFAQRILAWQDRLFMRRMLSTSPR